MRSLVPLCVCLCMFVNFVHLNQGTDFCEMLYERYFIVNGAYPNAAFLNSLQLVGATWRTC
jgi:hypothetical protein